MMEGCADADLVEKEKPEEAPGENMEGDDKESSDSSDDESDEQIALLEKEVADNPYLYDGHTQLIKKLQTAGELKRLQEAREKMASIFPLTSELWLEWINDEKKVMLEGERDHITVLFERAVKDYTSVELWLEFIQFSIGGMGNPGGVQATRAVCERAITATGLHVAMAALLWDAYRMYEGVVSQMLAPKPGSVATREEQHCFEAQTQRVLNVFRRQLSVPLNNMESTWEEFKDFTEEDEQNKVKPLYEKALAKLEKLRPFEDALLVADNLTPFEDYLDFELASGEPARIQCLFERALCVHCLIPRLWVRYTQYLTIELKIPELVLSVYDRAVRNCTWSSELWCGYGRALEKYERAHDQTKAMFVRALSSGFTSDLEYLTVWNAYLDYLRRRTPWNVNEAEEQEELWDTFDQAITTLSENFGIEGDPECTLQRYKARLKAKHCKDMAAVRLLWNEVMQAGHGNKAAMWLEFFSLERAYGDYKHTRKILQRALNSANDFPELVVQTYIRFEREEGHSVNDYDTAVCRCEAQMSRIEERRAAVAEKEAATEAQKKTVRKEKKVAKKTAEQQDRQKQNTPGNKAQKGPFMDKGQLKADVGAPILYTRGQTKGEPMEAAVSTEVRPYKRKVQEDEAQDDTFKVPAVVAPPAKKSKAPPPGFKPKTPAPGDTGPNSESDEELAAKRFTAESSAKEVTHSDTPHVVDTSKENRTVFVSNLDFKTKEVQIRSVLDPVGEITDLRLIKSFSGKSKGYAYVEFIDELLVAEAIKLDRTPIEGRPMFISKCNERSNNSVTFKYATTMEKNKLFVRGLPFSLTQDDIQEMFAKHGKVKEVRLVVYRSGGSKGIAYVDYEKESDASQAVMKMDGHVIGEHALNVAISNPPQRKAPAGPGFTPALGGGKRDAGGRGKAGTQLCLVPRSLQRRPPVSDNTAANGAGDQAATKMSNQDFRAMLLKK